MAQGVRHAWRYGTDHTMTRLGRRLGSIVLRSSRLSEALRTLAHLRGRRLALVYHRLCATPTPAGELVPTVPVDVFRAQLNALRDTVDLVTLDELVSEERDTNERRKAGYRPAVAVTFDDDLASHAEHALPILRELGVPATFFLSGRALHGQGPYGFQRLEALLLAHGAKETMALLGVSVGKTPDLVLACERSPTLRERVHELAAHLPATDILDGAGIAALSRGGMSVGFHTTSHQVLPDLDDTALDNAVTHGHLALAAAAGVAVRHFAYPYGRADSRSAAAVRRAGFVAAFTGDGQPIRRSDDRYRLGRWEPGPVSADDLLRRLAVRLHRGHVRPARQNARWM
jgi:peptidoglycan/xylan/chitin deacetylase (PgdA/CDA1 family)